MASAIQRVKAPAAMARPPPSSSAITSGSSAPGTPAASMYCWVPAKAASLPQPERMKIRERPKRPSSERVAFIRVSSKVDPVHPG